MFLLKVTFPKLREKHIWINASYFIWNNNYQFSKKKLLNHDKIKFIKSINYLKVIENTNDVDVSTWYSWF